MPLLPVTETNTEHTGTVSDHYVVAIGASAGGLEAIQDFFDNMPASEFLSFIIIQHLSPDYKSLLVELLSKHTDMRVVEASHDILVEKSTVYVIPNDKLLTIKNKRLQLQEKKFVKAPNTAIDQFFYSLAEDQSEKAIAVVLSGTGSDGTRGIQAIHDAGGLIMVQDPVTAKFDGMPNSAIASGYADLILTPELMPEEIFTYINEKPVRMNREDAPTERHLPEVLKLIEKHCSHDFANYKTPTILRRITRRMSQLQYTSFSEYLSLLRGSAEECKLLGKEFLIGVTKFFRDHLAFNIVREQVAPEIIRQKSDKEVLKIWVTACSTGEEAYSLAILFNEVLKASGKNLELKIFATDIDLEAIEFASRGTYNPEHLSDLDDKIKDEYFTKQNGKYTVNSSLRKQIVFARHNILKDPPFIKNDLVSCRNMLIYMNGILQRKVCQTLQFSLNTGGYLFLGPSEVPSQVRDAFDEVNSKWKIYRKVFSDNRFNAERLPYSTNFRDPDGRAATVVRESGLNEMLVEDFRNALTSEYGFAAVYVNANFEIKDAVGDYRRYLSLPEKNFNLNLLKMVKPEVSDILNPALRKVAKEKAPVTLANIYSYADPGAKPVKVMIRPASKNDLIMLVFSDSVMSPVEKPGNFVPPSKAESSDYIFKLEDELKTTRANLQLAIESLETANEELQSSNEELLSANEELQSGNEELQSLNEELHTLNTEHQLRIKELQELNDDLNNYFRSSEIAQIFVDADLRIRKFNPAAVEMVNLIETDIGRPIDHISNNIQDQRLVKDIEIVMATGKELEKEIALNSDKVLLLRILPYLRQDRNVDGVVIAFIDITNLKQHKGIIEGFFNASHSAMMAFRHVEKKNGSSDLLLLKANQVALDLMNLHEAEAIERSIRDILPQLTREITVEQLQEVRIGGAPLQQEVLVTQAGGQAQWYLLSAASMGEGVALNLTNIHEKKISEEKFKANYHELLRTKENYRRLNLELEAKVQERTQTLSASEERFRRIAGAISDAIWDWDMPNSQLWWSDSFYEQFGYDKAEKTASMQFLLSRLHEEDRKRVEQELENAMKAGAPLWTSRFRLQKQDGNYATVVSKASILKDGKDTPYRMVGALMDVTETETANHLLKIKHEELQSVIQEFRFVTDFMPQMVWATHPDGYHNFFNKQWYDYTGLDYEQTKDKGWSTVLHPDDYQRTWKVWNESLQTGKVYEIEYRMRRYDGEYRWFLGRAIPLRDENGKILKWFGTCTDIHDQKLMTDILEHKVQDRTKELQKANRELEDSNAELLQFASVASHDLKEPLRKIHLYSTMFKDRYLDKENANAAAYLDRIIMSSARMTKLINDLLTFTRLSGNSPFEEEDLNVVVNEVLSDLELVIQEKAATINVGNLPKAEIVSGQMRQVFQNLVSNALKFIDGNRTPVIDIRGEIVDSCSFDARPDAAGGCCRITIKDNGIGFEQHFADKIFVIFQRLHARENYEGTGIGLAITRKIIEKHNGLIKAESEVGKGATFTIVLPLAQPTARQH